jgi:hypothetical protein
VLLADHIIHIAFLLGAIRNLIAMATKEANIISIEYAYSLGTVRAAKPKTLTAIVAGSSIKRYSLFYGYPFAAVFSVSEIKSQMITEASVADITTRLATTSPSKTACCTGSQ